MYRREIIPDIEDKHAAIYEGGCFKVVAANQDYGAGTQRDKVYQRDILEDFCQWDWILFKQPQQSYVTNVKDA